MKRSIFFSSLFKLITLSLVVSQLGLTQAKAEAFIAEEMDVSFEEEMKMLSELKDYQPLPFQEDATDHASISEFSDSLKKETSYSGVGTWGYQFILVNKDGKKDLVSQYRADQLMVPASTQKVSTGYMAYRKGCYSNSNISYLLHVSSNVKAEEALRRCGGVSKLKTYYQSEPFFLGADDYTPADGSGLSIRNVVKPSAQVKILEGILNSGKYSTFKEMLAQPAEYGTLRKRFSGKNGKVFAKTGTMPNFGVKSLMGFYETNKGVLLFSVIVNNASGRTGAAFDQIEDMVLKVARQVNSN